MIGHSSLFKLYKTKKLRIHSFTSNELSCLQTQTICKCGNFNIKAETTPFVNYFGVR